MRRVLERYCSKTIYLLVHRKQTVMRNALIIMAKRECDANNCGRRISLFNLNADPEMKLVLQYPRSPPGGDMFIKVAGMSRADSETKETS